MDVYESEGSDSENHSSLENFEDEELDDDIAFDSEDDRKYGELFQVLIYFKSRFHTMIDVFFSLIEDQG